MSKMTKERKTEKERDGGKSGLLAASQTAKMQERKTANRPKMHTHTHSKKVKTAKKKRKFMMK